MCVCLTILSGGLKSEKKEQFRDASSEKKFQLSSLLALCLIFTILVLFSQDNALFASKSKINVF